MSALPLKNPLRLVQCALLVGVIMSASCSPLALLNASVPARTYRLQADQAYGADSRQRVDVYIPDAVSDNSDVVVFFYGGRWRAGDKRDYRFVAQALTKQGFIAVIADYRLYPQVDWRDLIADAAAAYRWTETHIAAYRGNPRRIFLMGHSSGAHLAAMVALDDMARRQAGSEIAPCGLIGLAGPYDFLPFTDADVREVFHSARVPLETQPIYYADGDDPAALLLTGAADTTVKPGNAERLAAALHKGGGQAQVISYARVAHAGILISLASPLRFYAPTLADTAQFIRATRCEGDRQSTATDAPNSK